MKKNYFLLTISTAFLKITLNAQCGTCTTTISNANNANHTITSGQTLCITATGSISGLITVSTGGTLCNLGAVNSPNLWVMGGTFNNYGNINTNQLMVSNNGNFSNNGTSIIDSLLITGASSNFTNSGVLTNIRFTTAANAITTNNGSIISNFLFDSVAVFNNNGNLTVNFDIGNAYNSNFNSSSNSFLRINRDFYNSTGATFNTGNCMAIVGRDWYNSAIVKGPNTPSCGGFSIAGLSLNSGTIGSASTHIDLCDAGSPTFGIDGNSGTIINTTTYCACTNNCTSVGFNETSRNSNIYNVFPNPAKNYITVNINSNKIENINIQLIDMMGKVVQNNIYPIEIGLNTIELHTTELVAGTYILNTINKQNIQSKKLIIITK